MAGPRALWRGRLKLGELVAGVALHSAATTSDRIAFNLLNRKTGNRLHREFVDEETEEPVAREDQIKGYETETGETILLEPEDIAAAVPESDKTLAIDAFLPCEAVDTLYLDKPYFLSCGDPASAEAFELIAAGMRAKKVAAIARTVLFRRLRSVLLRPHGEGLIAATLKFDYEVRSADMAFEEIEPRRIEPEMLDLAGHIIETKRGAFEPNGFEDRYEAALAELVKAKLEGRTIKARPKPTETKVVSLLDALRASVGSGQAARSGDKSGVSKTSADKKSASKKSAGKREAKPETRPAARRSRSAA